ncbi:2-phospho-L-lactate guanylyltransferase [Streptomyces sp. PLK6-54]|uniref:Phosphoenolpyruvate guanylyltransferase n=1 Tax=Actinacidiphila acidipaludis TaxID=2873382 RepID=A0ABS7QFD1_9ACTN|nr:2-phospho-L-lactate guanylyltransferase [Streptomyces acidipaludis]
MDRAEGTGGVWSLVVPLKPLALAKSRLAQATGEVRPALALAFALDTVAAALACPRVADVTVVTDDPTAGRELARLGAFVVPDVPAAGLNAALRYGAERVRERREPGGADTGAGAGGRYAGRAAAKAAGRAEGGVAALNGDLPALRPAELSLVLDEAARAPERAFLADAAGVGTTLLAAAPGVALSPAFGGPSRARHLASGAREITLARVPSVRQDVDTAEDLRAAGALGLGPRTAALLGAVPSVAAQAPGSG